MNTFSGGTLNVTNKCSSNTKIILCLLDIGYTYRKKYLHRVTLLVTDPYILLTTYICVLLPTYMCVLLLTCICVLLLTCICVPLLIYICVLLITCICVFLLACIYVPLLTYICVLSPPRPLPPSCPQPQSGNVTGP